MQEGHRPGSLLLQWHVTERCNLRCAHCYQGPRPQADLPRDGLIEVLRQYTELLDSWNAPETMGTVQSGSADRLAPAADRAAAARGRSRQGREPTERRRAVRGHITVTGGEPFLRPDFFELLEIFADRRPAFTFAVLTNGTLLDRAAVRRLSSLGPSFVQVSIEGTEAAHDEIRGRGSHRAAVSALRLLVKAGVRTFISFTAHRGNFRDFGAVARLGRRLGVARVWADRLIPLGAGSDLDPLTPDETRELVASMREARREADRSWLNRTEIAMDRALQFLAAGGGPYRCTAGDSLLAVMPGGDLYPCRRMPIRIGNVFETPLAELYSGSGMLRALRNGTGVSSGCEECVFARLCRGGLRCFAHAATGDPFRADPGCWHANGMK